MNVVRCISGLLKLLLFVPVVAQACAENADICEDTVYCVKDGGDAGLGGAGSPGSCHADGDCDDDNPCTRDECASGGTCTHAPVDDYLNVHECTDVGCAGGVRIDTPAELGKGCGINAVCDGLGKCVSLYCGDDGQCPSGYECAGEQCKLANGSQCDDPEMCASNWCVDGVCCVEQCAGMCVACSIGSNLGTCTNMPVHQQDVGKCEGDTIACDGDGGCKLANDEPCDGDSDCASGNCSGVGNGKVCQ